MSTFQRDINYHSIIYIFQIQSHKLENIKYNIYKVSTITDRIQNQFFSELEKRKKKSQMTITTANNIIRLPNISYLIIHDI